MGGRGSGVGGGRAMLAGGADGGAFSWCFCWCF